MGPPSHVNNPHNYFPIYLLSFTYQNSKQPKTIQAIQNNPNNPKQPKLTQNRP